MNNKKIYQKNVYYTRKNKGLCVRCGKNKAVPNRTECPYCSYKDLAKRRKRYKHNPQKTIIKMQKQRKLWKENNRCPTCGKQKPEDCPTIKCQNCIQNLTTKIIYPLFYPGGSYETFNTRST